MCPLSSFFPSLLYPLYPLHEKGFLRFGSLFRRRRDSSFFSSLLYPHYPLHEKGLLRFGSLCRPRDPTDVVVCHQPLHRCCHNWHHRFNHHYPSTSYSLHHLTTIPYRYNINDLPVVLLVQGEQYLTPQFCANCGRTVEGILHCSTLGHPITKCIA